MYLNFNLDTVIANRLATHTVDWPPLSAMYCLPYEIEEEGKFVFFLGYHNFLIMRVYEKDPKLQL